HAKSSWDDTALPDKERPVGDRGRRDAPKMGKRLAKRDVKPDLILSSPARRALTTAEIIAKKLDYKLKDIVVDDRLYAGAVHSLLNVIHGLGDKPERVMLFGHNPELTEFAHRLSGEITVPVGNLRSEISVMQAAQNWHCQRATDSLDGTRDRRVLVQR